MVMCEDSNSRITGLASIVPDRNFFVAQMAPSSRITGTISLPLVVVLLSVVSAISAVYSGHSHVLTGCHAASRFSIEEAAPNEQVVPNSFHVVLYTAIIDLNMTLAMSRIWLAFAVLNVARVVLAFKNSALALCVHRFITCTPGNASTC